METHIIEASSNPSFGNMKKFLEEFNGVKANSFDQRLAGSDLKGQFGSLVTLRNDVAHGRSINVSINTIYTYWQAGLAVLNVFDEVLAEEN